jgi:signal transduction histidine kinase
VFSNTFALGPLIGDVVRTIEPLAAKNGNRVVGQCDDAIDTIHADQSRVRQTPANLASNANKFTEKGTGLDRCPAAGAAATGSRFR